MTLTILSLALASLKAANGIHQLLVLDGHSISYEYDFPLLELSQFIFSTTSYDQYQWSMSVEDHVPS